MPGEVWEKAGCPVTSNYSCQLCLCNDNLPFAPKLIANIHKKALADTGYSLNYRLGLPMWRAVGRYSIFQRLDHTLPSSFAPLFHVIIQHDVVGFVIRDNCKMN